MDMDSCAYRWRRGSSNRRGLLARRMRNPDQELPFRGYHRMDAACRLWGGLWGTLIAMVSGQARLATWAGSVPWTFTGGLIVVTNASLRVARGWVRLRMIILVSSATGAAC